MPIHRFHIYIHFFSTWFSLLPLFSVLVLLVLCLCNLGFFNCIGFILWVFLQNYSIISFLRHIPSSVFKFQLMVCFGFTSFICLLPVCPRCSYCLVCDVKLLVFELLR